MLGMYLGSVAFSYLLIFMSIEAVQKRLDREGYVDVYRKEASFLEKLLDFTKVSVVVAIPVINLLFGLVNIFVDTYEKDLKEGLDEGYVRKKNAEELREELEKKDKKRKQKQELKDAKFQAKLQKIQNKESKKIKEAKTNQEYIPFEDIENNKVKFKKSYSQMSDDEKLEFLENEKAFLLSQKENNEAKSYNDRGTYKK